MRDSIACLSSYFMLRGLLEDYKYLTVKDVHVIRETCEMGLWEYGSLFTLNWGFERLRGLVWGMYA